MPVATKKLRSNRAWIERHINDPFVKRSRAEGYRARSVYKLIELDEKEHLLKPGSTVVDLGSAPGSWTQVVRERLAGPDGSVRGRIIAMDILPMDPIDDGYFLQGDFREQEVADKLAEILNGDKVDVVLSTWRRIFRASRRPMQHVRCCSTSLRWSFASNTLRLTAYS